MTQRHRAGLDRQFFFVVNKLRCNYSSNWFAAFFYHIKIQVIYKLHTTRLLLSWYCFGSLLDAFINYAEELTFSL